MTLSLFQRVVLNGQSTQRKAVRVFSTAWSYYYNCFISKHLRHELFKSKLSPNGKGRGQRPESPIILIKIQKRIHAI